MIRWADAAERCVLGLLIVMALASMTMLTFDFNYADQHYGWLADAFVHGRLWLDPSFLDGQTVTDTVFRNGVYYWPLGPLPALVLAPFAAFAGPSAMLQSFGQVAVALIAWACAFSLARKEGFSRSDASWLSAAFALGSVFIGSMMYPLPWYFAGTLAALSGLAAVLESRGKDRPVVIGALLGAAFGARLTAGAIGVVYFGVRELFSQRHLRERATRIARMALPVALVLVALGWYNAVRFGSPFDNGYSDSRLGPSVLETDRTQKGLFDLSYVGRNVHEYFLATPRIVDGVPVPTKLGYSVVLMAPVFLWLFAARGKTKGALPAAAATCAAFAIFLPYYSSGASQFGPRYLNDVLPYWFALLVAVFAERGFGLRPKAVIALSAVANILLANAYALHNLFHFF